MLICAAAEEETSKCASFLELAGAKNFPQLVTYKLCCKKMQLQHPSEMDHVCEKPKLQNRHLRSSCVGSKLAPADPSRYMESTLRCRWAR